MNQNNRPIVLDLHQLEQDNPLLDSMLADLGPRAGTATGWVPTFGAVGEKDGKVPLDQREISRFGVTSANSGGAEKDVRAPVQGRFGMSSTKVGTEKNGRDLITAHFAQPSIKVGNEKPF